MNSDSSEPKAYPIHVIVQLLLAMILLIPSFTSTPSVAQVLASNGKAAVIKGSTTLTNMEELFKYLEEEHGVTVTYAVGTFDLQKPFVLNIDRASPKEMIEEGLFHVLPRGSTFTIRERKNTYALQILAHKVKDEATGTIEGRVYDEDNSSEPLVGATVRIEGTVIGSATDATGKFRIDEVPTGTYSLIVSFIGYGACKISNVTVYDGTITTVNVPLKMIDTELENVVIEADIPVQYDPLDLSTEVTMISSIKNSNLIFTGISNEQIIRSQDQDAAEVASRIPGVSLLNNFILIRGMNPRYNPAMINNMLTPSSEMDTRAFSFDLIPSQVIDRMEVYKSPAPELLGNFGGGIVKIFTKNSAQAQRLQVSVAGFARDNGSSFSNYITYEGSNRDWLGAGISDRQLPSQLTDQNFTVPQLNGPDGFITEQILQGLPAARIPQEEYHNVDKQLNINYYDSWKLFGNARINNLTSLTYNNRRAFRFLERNLDAGQVSMNSEGELETSAARMSFDSLYRETINISALQTFNFVINENHNVEVNGFFNRTANDDVLIRTERDVPGALPFEEAELEKVYSYRYTSRDLLQLQVSGNHRFGTHKVNWSAGINRAIDIMPDLQRYRFIKQAGDSLWITQLTTGFTTNTRFEFETDDEAQLFQLNYENEFSEYFYVKTGGYLELRDRKFQSYRYRTVPFGEFDLRPFRQREPEPWKDIVDTLYIPENYHADGTGLNFEGFEEGGSGKYSFDDEIRAGYLGLGTRLFNRRLEIYGGVRYEWNNRFLLDVNGNNIDSVAALEGFQIRVPVPNGVTDFWLPSVNVSYDLSGKSLIRAAYGKTIDRPEYREASTFGFFDFEAGFNVRSNPAVITAEIHNIDMRYEHYPSESEFIALGVFYKRLKNAIEQVDWSGPGFVIPAITFENTPEAEVYGVEAEVRKNLEFFSHRLRNFSLIFNTALVKSRVEFDPGETELRVGFTGDEILERSLQGTSPYIINASLFYDNEKWGTQASILYNMAGPRLVAAPTATLGGLFERQRNLVDLSVTQKITKWVNAKVGVQNLLDAPFRFYRDDNVDNRFNPDRIVFPSEDPGRQNGRKDFEEIRYRIGRYYSLAFNFTF